MLATGMRAWQSSLGKSCSLHQTAPLLGHISLQSGQLRCHRRCSVRKHALRVTAAAQVDSVIKVERLTSARNEGTTAPVAESTTIHVSEYSPCSIRRPFWQPPDSSTRPYLLYLPDLDGVGLTGKKQWQGLADAFDFEVLELRPDDRSTFEQLVQFVKEHLENEHADTPMERPVFLMGEGFGAVIALAVALQCRAVNRLLLVNPATSYPESPLAQAGPLLARLPTPLYQLAPLALLPALSNPIKLTANFLPLQPSPSLPTTAAANILQEALPQLQQLASSLLPDTLAWRLAVLEAGCREVVPRLKEVYQRTIVLVGELDLVLPSAKHAEDELKMRLQRGFVKVLPERGHALLSEADMDLVALLKEEGFYTSQLRFTSAPTRSTLNSPAGPIEVPTPEEVKWLGSPWTSRIRDLSSPVFLSTLDDGRIVPGLDGLPLERRPLLFVGNHQVYAFDMYVLVEELVLRTGLLPRGLAHPGLFRDTQGNDGVERKSTSVLPDVVSNTYRTFGAVPVSGQNFFRLLQRKESVLLYPGGVREGFKRKNEKYRLFWPEQAEFVRMAARFGATIVPMSSIGVEDGLEILYDTDEIKKDPWLGPRANEQAATIPDARTGIEPDEWDQTFIPPLIAPKVPARFYFIFHKPITLEKADASNKERCAEVYRHVKSEVENGISYLMQKREQDPYGEFLKRYLYEHPFNQPPRQAPTFEP